VKQLLPARGASIANGVLAPQLATPLVVTDGGQRGLDHLSAQPIRKARPTNNIS